MPRRRYLRRLRDKDVKGIDLLIPAGLAFGAGIGLQVASWLGLLTIAPAVPWLAVGAGVLLLVADALKRGR